MTKVTIKHSRISRGSSIGMLLLGVITLLFVSGLLGLILIAVGGVMYWFYRRQARDSLAGGRNLGAKSHAGAVESRPQPAPSQVVKEKEIHVVVRIPCKYCGTLNDQLRTKCESCGASLR